MGQDPVYWNLSEGYLFDPQQQNSYSYGRNNPVKYIDSNGQAAQIVIPLLAGAVVGAAAQGVVDIYNGESSGWRSYINAAAQGSIVTGAAVLSAGAGLGFIGTAGTIGLTDFTYRNVASYTNNGPILTSQMVVNSTFTGLAGPIADKTVGKVVGRWPNMFTQAFFTGKHTQNIAQKEIVSTISSAAGASSVSNITQTSNESKTKSRVNDQQTQNTSLGQRVVNSVKSFISKLKN